MIFRDHISYSNRSNTVPTTSLFPTPSSQNRKSALRISSPFSSLMKHHHHHSSSPPLTRRTALIAASVLILLTFFLTRLFFCAPSSVPASSSKSRAGGIVLPIPLRVYVYDESEIDGLKELMRGRDGKIRDESCVKGQWGTQVKIHKLLLESKYRTMNKDEADLFFVPTYVKCVRMMGGLSDKEINQAYIKVLSQMPYFRRSGGRDHIFVFPSGAGAHLFKSWNKYLNLSIFLTPEGDRTDKKNTSAFNTWKDIIIPGNIDDSMTGGSPIINPLPLNKRKYLANFLGRAQNKTGRLQLIRLAKQFPHKLESPELKFKGPDKLGRKEYFEHLRNAKFCLAPRGESSWTLRFYESFFVECVPVILSDEIELPFEDDIDYKKVSIKWPSNKIGTELLDYLDSIPDEKIEAMIERGRKIRCFFVYSNLEKESCSAMLGIISELQKKKQVLRHSKDTFWLDDEKVVNRYLEEFPHWTTPVPLP
ncbi:hypothetical protein LUZ60_015942 [Juncus effusus]|nr:hypothetical protein LUZ60_015942 [Juncus effusus]